MASFERKAHALTPVHAAASSQHGFHVKAGIPPIQEASLAEERGDSGTIAAVPAPQWQPWRSVHAEQQQARMLGMLGEPPLQQQQQQVGGLKSMTRMQVEQRSTSGSNSSSSESHNVEVLTAHSSSGVRRLLKSVVRGLRACQEPEASSEGLGGTYFFMNEAGRRAAIVKPCDEEPLAPNNPKGFVGRALGDPGLKPSVRVGEAAVREVAAFLLDHDHFSSVPHTVLVKVAHSIFHQQERSGSAAGSPSSAGSGMAADAEVEAMSTSFGSNLSISLAKQPGMQLPDSPTCAAPLPKLSSLQEYVNHDCDTSEMGASRFAARDVHRIGILDIRIWNTDRHAGNILVRRPRAASIANLGALARLDSAQLELVPIDHGFCLPESLDPPYLEWLHWPAAMIPFGEEELAYIARLDAAADCALLRRELPSLREESLRTLEVATALLQRCAAAGLTLAEIGAVVSRPLVGLDEESSELERLCLAARAAVADAAAREAAAGLCDSETSEDDEDAEGSSAEDACGLENGGGAFLGMQQQLPPVLAVSLGAEHSGLLRPRALLVAASGGSGVGEPMDCTSSSRLSSGTLYNVPAGAGSFELTFLGPVAANGEARLAHRPSPLASARGSAEDDTSLADVSANGGPLSASGSRSQEELLFDLEEAHAYLGTAGAVAFEPVTPTAAMAALACKPSPGACSDAASLSFSPLPGHLPREVYGVHACSSPDEGPHGGLAHAARQQEPLLPAVTLPAQCGSLARHDDGRAWQRSKQAPRRHGGKRGPRRAHAPTLATGASARKTPEGSSLFSGLDAAKWGVFMAALEAGMAQALADGRWKQAQDAGKLGACGVSCPRF